MNLGGRNGMELDEVLTDIRTLKAECEMLLRITALVEDIERERESPEGSAAGAVFNDSIYMH
jgi:hypothetical protein